MNLYLLERLTDGGAPTGYFVAKGNSRRSYTRDVRNVAIFDTREAAEAHACANERVVSIRDLILRE